MLMLPLFPSETGWRKFNAVVFLIIENVRLSQPMPYSLQKIPFNLFQRNESIIKQLDSVLGRESVCYPIRDLNSFRDVFLAAQHFYFLLAHRGR